jgi:hypothetical protein
MSGTARGVDGWNGTIVSVGENGHAKKHVSFGTFLFKRKVRYHYWIEHFVWIEPDHINIPEIDIGYLKKHSFQMPFQ